MDFGGETFVAENSRFGHGSKQAAEKLPALEF